LCQEPAVLFFSIDTCFQLFLFFLAHVKPPIGLDHELVSPCSGDRFCGVVFFGRTPLTYPPPPPRPPLRPEPWTKEYAVGTREDPHSTARGASSSHASISVGSFICRVGAISRVLHLPRIPPRRPRLDTFTDFWCSRGSWAMVDYSRFPVFFLLPVARTQIRNWYSIYETALQYFHVAVDHCKFLNLPPNLVARLNRPFGYSTFPSLVLFMSPCTRLTHLCGLKHPPGTRTHPIHHRWTRG